MAASRDQGRFWILILRSARRTIEDCSCWRCLTCKAVCDHFLRSEFGLSQRRDQLIVGVIVWSYQTNFLTFSGQLQMTLVSFMECSLLWNNSTIFRCKYITSSSTFHTHTIFFRILFRIDYSAHPFMLFSWPRLVSSPAIWHVIGICTTPLDKGLDTT